MEANQNKTIQVIDIQDGEWSGHPRFPGIEMKGLLTSAQNPHASANIVRVPPGGLITQHSHAAQMETVFVLKGASKLRFGGQEYAFNQGCIVALPSGLAHELENTGRETVELLTFFTPPLV